MFIIVNKENIVIEIASQQNWLSEKNLADKSLSIVEIPEQMTVNLGDEYNSDKHLIIERPDNRPPISEEEQIESKIQEEIRSIAINNLKTKGEISQNYEDRRKV